VADFRAEFLALDSDSSGTINAPELEALGVVGNSMLLTSESVNTTPPFDDMAEVLQGIIHPRQLRHNPENGGRGATLSTGTIAMDEDSDDHSLGMVKMGSGIVTGHCDSLSSSPGGGGLDIKYGTSESCSSLYTHPSSLAGQKSSEVDSSSRNDIKRFVYESSAGVITYSEYIAAAMCGRLEIHEERVAVAFDLLDRSRQGALTADAIASFLGKDIDIARLHHDILLTKSQVYDKTQMEFNMDDGGIDIDHSNAGIDQATFF